MRLIDADALIGQYKGSCLTAKTDYAEGLRDVIADIKDAPTIDAVPVVRCRECKWGRTVRECDEYVWCGKPYAPPWASHKADWYCADGKRKEDAELSEHKAKDRRDA